MGHQHANEQQKHIPWRCKKYLFADHATPSSHPSSWAVVRPGTGVARERLGATTIKFRNNVNWNTQFFVIFLQQIKCPRRHSTQCWVMAVSQTILAAASLLSSPVSWPEPHCS